MNLTYFGYFHFLIWPDIVALKYTSKCNAYLLFLLKYVNMFRHSAINQRATPLLGGNQFGAQNRWRWCWSLPLRCKNGLAYAKEIEKEARAISLLWHIKNRTLCAGSYCSWSISPSAKNFAHKKRHQRLPLFYSVRPRARKVEFFSCWLASAILARRAQREPTLTHTPQGATHAHKHSLRGHKEKRVENVMQ